MSEQGSDNTIAVNSTAPITPPPPRWSRLFAALKGAVAERVQRFNPWLLLLVPACYLATTHFLQGRYPITHSFAPNIIWAFEWTQQFRAGILFPRWTEYTFAGLGSPTFHFYAPLCMYMVLPFSVGLKLPITTSVLMSSMLTLPVLGIGVARLSDDLHGTHRRWIAGVAGALAVLAPYTWLDIYGRGAMAEAWGMAVLPWFLSALFRSESSPSTKSRFPLVIATAMLGLCHAPVFLITMSSTFLCMLITSSDWKQVEKWLIRGALPILVGIALDGFYLASAILDQRYVQVDYINVNTGGMPTYNMLAQEIGKLSTKVSDGFAGDMVPGFVIGATGAIWAAVLLWRRGHPDNEQLGRRVAFLVGLFAICSFMMVDLSKGVYGLLPTFNRIQFAWRWLTLCTVVTTALWSFVLSQSSERARTGYGISRMLAWIGVICAATLSQALIPPQVDWRDDVAQHTDALLQRTHSWQDLGDPADSPKEVNGGLLFADSHDRLLYLDVHEYMPTSKANGGFPPRLFEPVEWASGSGTISNLVWKNGLRSFHVSSPTGGVLLVRTTAWLGWAVEINGARSVGDVAGNQGRLSITLPKGASDVSVRYAGTTNQHLGELLTVLTLLGVAGVYVASSRGSTEPNPKGAWLRGKRPSRVGRAYLVT